jgi:hypothetical protein
MKRKPNTPSFKEAPQLPQSCCEGARTEELFWHAGKWLVSEQGWKKALRVQIQSHSKQRFLEGGKGHLEDNTMTKSSLAKARSRRCGLTPWQASRRA